MTITTDTMVNVRGKNKSFGKLTAADCRWLAEEAEHEAYLSNLIRGQVEAELERRLRDQARTQGLSLRKQKATGLYGIVNRDNTWETHGYILGLEEVHKFLNA